MRPLGILVPKHVDADIKEQDRLRNQVVNGLRAEQALPFIKPYLDLRKSELMTALKIYADNSNKDKVFEVGIRISEVETILVQLGVDTTVGRRADGKLSKAAEIMP